MAKRTGSRSRHTKRSARRSRRHGGSTLTDLAVPAMLMYANNTIGKGRRYFAARTPYTRRRAH